MLKNRRSQPDKWFNPFKHKESPKLATNENVAMIVHFEVINKIENDTSHCMFMVVRKENKAIARTIIVHNGDKGLCEGHADDVAEYPIENEETLAEEIKNYSLEMAQMLANEDEDYPLRVNTAKPVFYLKTPKNNTNEDMLKAFEENTAPEGIIPKQVIAATLGLGKTQQKVQIPMQTNEEINEKINKSIKASKEINKLQNEAKEKELIKKFGKKRMLQLAKRMNYQGAILNKTKTKTHAK